MSTDTRKQPSEPIQTEQGRFWIYPVIGYYDIITHDLIPFGGFTLKVIDTKNGEFRAIPNVQVYNTMTRCVEYVCGIGNTVDETISDAIRMFMIEVQKQLQNKAGQDLDDADFIWLNWQPYIQSKMPITT